MNSNCHDTESRFELLYDEINDLIEHVWIRGLARVDQYGGPDKSRTLSKSIVNLGHYLAMREIDLRPLQEKLAQAGLSSLGRAEPHVYANLRNVRDMLSRSLGKSTHEKAGFSYPEFGEGDKILAKNAATILGNVRRKMTRTMVTLPTEAAANEKLVRDLVNEGMNIARINCAHDDISTWHRMVDNIRRASAELNAPCRILMDLAGHKIRTGSIMSDPQSLFIKIKKKGGDHYPNAIRFDIVSDEQNQPEITDSSKNAFIFPVPRAVYSNLESGDRLSLVDAQGKSCFINILLAPENNRVIGLCDKTIHLITGLLVTWQRRIDTSYADQHTFRFVNLNTVAKKARLFTGDLLFLHKQPPHGFVLNDRSDEALKAAAHISCSSPDIIDILQQGDRVWIDDGKISAYVSEKDADYVVLRVTRAGIKGAKLKSDMGLNFPETVLNLPTLTSKDLSDLDFICAHADIIGLSFIETADGISELIAELQRRNATQLPIIAKIETARAVKNLPEILFASLSRHPVGVMIARGDLAIELGHVRMAEIQEEILWLCEAAHVPVIWATQVLESIAKHGIGSRPEFTDAAMSVRAECVMLNKGPYILDALRSLNAVLKCMQAHQRKKISRLRALHW
ncbi:pyruvate kinase [Nitrosomonas marina]|uniref:pyruvate kinase n=1 Tax=Nitrosomonas marina TaxID=917 RepID=A0A1I0F762_9PROT|nr:pyruvate kinase [Nitrosomonas marina]SET53093.1 pyruvate kinase [Nitrosomonas marina]